MQGEEKIRNLHLNGERRLGILQSLSEIYSSIYEINLREDSFEELTSLAEVHEHIGSTGKAQERLIYFCNHMVLPKHRDDLMEFVDLSTLSERLKESRVVSKDYINTLYVKPGEKEEETFWSRCSFVKGSVDEDGELTHVLFVNQNIHEEKSKELEAQKRAQQVDVQNKLIEALTIPYENVYVVNMDTGRATCYRRGKEMRDRYGERFTLNDYREGFSFYVENDVLEEDRPLFDQILSVERVEKVLQENSEYSFTYRIFREQRVQYFQCQLIKPSPSGRDFIVAFKNIDAVVEKELRNIRIQEEQHRIIKALSNEYHSLFKINSKTGELSLYRTDGEGLDQQEIDKLVHAGDYESVVNQYIDHFVVPEDRERMRKAIQLEVLLEKVPEVGLYKLGYQRERKGICSYYEMNVAKTRDDSDTVIFIMALRDVNDEMQLRLRQAAELQEKNEIIEGLGSEYYSILIVYPQSNTVNVYRGEGEDGRAIAKHFEKYTTNFYAGINCYMEEHLSEKCKRELKTSVDFHKILEDKIDTSITYEKMVKDGVCYLQARIAFVQEKDGEYVVVIGTRNVDDLIKRERQQEMALREAYNVAEAANRAKTDFLSSMSHDIRTPMNAIIGMTAIAAAHIDDKERVQDSLAKITQASKHLLSLINEVLDMNKIESGKVDLVEEEFELSELIDNMLSMTSSQIQEHKHHISVNITDVVHEKVIGDSLRIQKVFTNIIGNAVKYTPEGGKLRLTISERPCNQTMVGCFEFVFEDNGIGMSKDFLEKIFEPFARGQDPRVDKIQGTGLGMAISRNIVRMMGGDITVESKLGEGSKFTVTVYLKLQDYDDSFYDGFLDLRVLVADDDRISVESCCSILNELGMMADGVLSGREALETVIEQHQKERDYYACILDWKMPDMSGLETAKAIRRAVGDEMPIIVISAYDWSEIEQEARDAGVNAFISKPLFRSRLERTFRKFVYKEQEPEPASKKGPEKINPENYDFSPCRALLAEDNELNAEIAVEILSMFGLEVERACDGLEAVDFVEEREDGYYDIIFMDIQMPKLNGYDATRAIRTMNREYCKRVPIIAMTANAFAEDVHAAKTVGMNEHIAKPLDLKALVKTLNHWLGKET